jgi:hypothetical protein
MAAKQIKREEHRDGSLPDKLVMSVGMTVMVTFNVETDLDIANSIVFILDDREALRLSRTNTIIILSYLPVYILIKTQSTNFPTLLGLDNGVIVRV